ncbi:MAG: ArsA family ATPase [Actinomycetota bacterium]
MTERGRAAMTTLGDVCATARIIVACGTGGVGKTSVAAAMGLVAARQGRRAVVLTIDPARRLTDAIGVSDTIGNEPVRVPLDVTGEIWISMLDVRETFDGLVRDTATTPDRAAEVLDNSFYKSLSQSISGTRDYMAAERLFELSADPRFDVVVVDTPPSRNALDFLESPERLARFLKHPIVRLLVAPGRGGLRLAGTAMQPVLRIISGIVGSDALSGAVAFLRAFDGMESEFSRRALAVAAALRGDDTAFVVVSGPSADALGEAGHFVDELRRLDIDLRTVVLNRMPPVFGDVTSAEAHRIAASSTGDTAVVHRLLADLTADAEGARDRTGMFLERARRAHPSISVATAAEMAVDIHDLDSIATLADLLTH